MHVIAIDRPGMNDHLMRPCGLTQQFPAPNPNVATKDGIKYFVIRTTCYLQSQTVMAASFVRFHLNQSTWEALA